MKIPEIKKKIREYGKLWYWVVGLDDWSIAFGWDETEHLGTATCWPEYRSIRCAFNLPRIQKEVDGEVELEALVLHELCHSLCWSLARNKDRLAPEPLVHYLEEDSTTKITTALLRARNMGKKRKPRRKGY